MNKTNESAMAATVANKNEKEEIFALISFLYEKALNDINADDYEGVKPKPNKDACLGEKIDALGINLFAKGFAAGMSLLSKGDN